MDIYCKACREVHDSEYLCSPLKKQLSDNPTLFKEAMDFINLAGQYHLVSSQTLDQVANGINKLSNTNINFEGSYQMARDIQVFKQLDIDPFNKSKVFSSSENARTYLEGANENQLRNLKRKISGTAQEVDWLRDSKGKLNEILNRAELVGKEHPNAPGIDGKYVNRITGKETGVSVKTSTSNKGLGTNVSDVLEALKKDTLKGTDIVVGTDGTKEAVEKMIDKNIQKAVENGDKELLSKLMEAKENMKVKEIGNYESTQKSTSRLFEKIEKGNANTTIGLNDVVKQARNGAVIGAAISISISSISNYIKYKNGEITKQEAFTTIGQNALKGAVTGAAMGALTLFIPGGPIGFIIGMGVGMYISTTTSNILEEIFGKGSVEAMINSFGYIAGYTANLADLIEIFEQNETIIKENNAIIQKHHNATKHNLKKLDDILGGL